MESPHLLAVEQTTVDYRTTVESLHSGLQWYWSHLTCTSAPLHLYTSAPLYLHLCTTTTTNNASTCICTCTCTPTALHCRWSDLTPLQVESPHLQSPHLHLSYLQVQTIYRQFKSQMQVHNQQMVLLDVTMEDEECAMEMNTGQVTIGHRVVIGDICYIINA